MEPKAVSQKKYRLAEGSQVREEDFGLLFYTMEGPRLFFLSSGELLGISFFEGHHTIYEWIKMSNGTDIVPDSRITELSRRLDQLRDKGVIIEC